MNKRFLSAVLAMALVLCLFPTPSFAADTIRVSLDGRILTLDQPPILENGRTLIPIRAVAECIGADVDWNNDSKVVTLDRAGIKVVLTIGSNTALVNGKSVGLDAAPVIVGGRTLLPLRFVAETFSQKVEWDGQNKVVKIEEDMSFAEGSNLHEWLLGVGAIMARLNSMDPYQIGMRWRTQHSVSSTRRSLSSAWGSDNREELLRTIDSIANNGHSYNFDFDVAMFKSLSSAEKNQILKTATGVDAYMWPFVMELDKKWGDKSIRAWDWFRVGHLCRWGYLAGYISAEEAYKLFEPTAKNLRRTFSSWDEATENYLDGYAYWGRIDVSLENNDFAKRKQVY